MTGEQAPLGSIPTLSATLLGIVRVRLDLFATELLLERLRFERRLLRVLLGLFFFSLGMLFLSALIVAACWETHRLAALAALGMFYLAIAGGLAIGLRGQKTKGELPFAASLAELDKDKACFGSRE